VKKIVNINGKTEEDVLIYKLETENEDLKRQIAELKQSQQTDNTNWVSANDKLPTVEQNGKKVLLFRILNDSQESQSVSIHETSMVKYCNKEETWWMKLPELPKILK
jgi:hypothetical protein